MKLTFDVYLQTKQCSNLILSNYDLQCIPIHLSKTFSVQRKTFSKAIFLKYFSSFDFCQDHDSHKGSNWNLFPTSTTLRKRGHYKYMFSNVRIGLLASKQEFKILHFQIELWLTGTFFDRILFYSCPDIGNSYVLFWIWNRICPNH